MFLLDTNICIYLMKNTYPGLSDKLFSCSPGDVAVSAVTVYELEYGAAKSRWGEKNRNMLRLFLAPFSVIPFGSDDAIAAGAIRAYLEQRGSVIGPYDLQIAAQALVRDWTLVTHNTGEFSRVPQLSLVDWVDELRQNPGKAR